jgi:divalent metal cation (Fe/Co/Zn/Cd) transporter
MIGILIWLAVAIATAWEITTHGLWRDGLAACAVFAFILWVIGGAAAFSARGRMPTRPSKAMTDAERQALLSISRKAATQQHTEVGQ